MSEILAIIPAREGSRGIPMKNIQNIADKSLIEYAISSATASSKITRIIVSTNDNKVAEIAKSLNVEVPFMRPKRLSKSTSRILDVIKHALKFLKDNESYSPDIITILQPTSPLRKAETIDKSVLMLQRSRATSVLGVSKVKIHPFLSFYYEGKYLRPFKTDFQRYYQRQKFPLLMYPTGSIYTFWYKTLQRYNSYYGPRIRPIIIREEDSIDIDSIFDLFVCDMKIRYWQKYKRQFS